MKNSKILMSVVTLCFTFVLTAQSWEQKYAVKTVANGGTVSGTIKYAGDAEVPKRLKVDKDKEVCSQYEPLYSESLIVNKKNKGIQNAVVSIKNITQGKDWNLPEGGPVMDQNGCFFNPHILVVPAGKQFIILNNDGILHNVHTHGTINRPVNKAQPKFLKELKMKIDQPEYVRITCDVHSWMEGWIAAAAHPYYVVTDENGAFKLDNIPPGSYELEIWHEKLGKQTQKVTAKSGTDAKVNVVFNPK